MNKLLFYISVFFLSFSLFGKEEKKPNKSTIWKQERESIRYQKDKKYKGPDEWYTDGPGSMRDESLDNYGSGGGYNGQQYNPQQIQKNRQKRNAGFDRGGGNGDGVYDPEIDRPDPIEFPEVDPPDVDPPDMHDGGPRIPVMFWKVLGFILLFAAVILIVYFWMKNRQPGDKKVHVQSLEND